MSTSAALHDLDRRRAGRLVRPAARKALLVALLSSAAWLPLPAAADDISDLKDALKQLQEQNKSLLGRISALEAEQAAQRRAQQRPAQPAPAQAAATPPPAQPPAQPQDQAAVSPPNPPASNEELDRRVRDLEQTRAAQEDATRSIIRGAKIGPRINEFLSLSGAIEVIAGRSQDFSGLVANTVFLNTAELDFDVKVGEWLTGSLILGFDPGQNPLFPTSQTGGTGTTGIAVDRMTVDRASITIGDPFRFPFFVKGGRDVIPFGQSTGFARTSGLSIESPLSIQVFETRTNFIQVGFEWPTPDLTRPTPPVFAPPVKPMVLGPLVNDFAHWVGYHPSGLRPSPLAPLPPLVNPAPFYGTVGFYQGSDLITGQFNFTNNITASLGYRARGSCGVPYSELTNSLICPWSFDVSVDFASSIFASNFLSRNYAPFLSQIGNVPALAANLRGSFGPFGLIAEYNTALRSAGFTDGLGVSQSIQPSAWQVSLGYQLGWNPWVEKIGDQGTFLAVGYSGSAGMAGTTALIGGVPTRVGFVPKSRLLLTAGEWVLEGLKFTLEGSIDWDYPVSQGGTGATGWGLLMGLTFTF